MIFSYVKVAEWPPFGKELLIRLTVSSLCNMSICNFGCFPFWIQGQDFGPDYSSSGSLLTFLVLFYFLYSFSKHRLLFGNNLD